MYVNRPFPIAIIVSLIWTSSHFLGAQNVVWDISGPSAGAWLGRSVDGIGDVNNDGFSEFILGAPYENSYGSAHVYDGATATILYTYSAPHNVAYFGHSVCGADDVDMDGIPDFAIGYPWRQVNGQNFTGTVYVYSGSDGSLIRSLDGNLAGEQFGFHIQSAGDVDDDGHADLIVGAPWNSTIGTNAGRAVVMSGADGSLLYEFFGAGMNSAFGYSVAGVGDLNADGKAEVVVGSPNWNTGVGSATVYSGADGSVVYSFAGQAGIGGFGLRVAGGSKDVNNDGIPDICVADINEYDSNTNGYGAVYVYSGAGGSQLWRFAAAPNMGGEYGSAIDLIGDLNNDGCSEILIGARRQDTNGTDSGNIRIHSGKDGAQLAFLNGPNAGDEYGDAVAGVEDLNGDQVPDFLVGAFKADSGGSASGNATVYSLGLGPSYEVRISVKRVLGPNGSVDPFWSSSNIAAWVQEASDIFSRSCNITFDLVEIKDIADPAAPFSLFQATTTDKEAMEDAMELDPKRFYWRTDAINVYLCDTLTNGGGSSVGGTCSLPDGDDYDDIILIQPNIGNDAVGLAHEIGHYFNLLHTHGTSMGVEDPGACPDGISPNCNTAGDLVCDTPGDPNDLPTLNTWYGTGSCFGTPPAVGTTMPEHPFNILRYNVMSYYQTIDSAEAILTNGQRERVISALETHRRAVTTAGPTPKVTSVSVTQTVYPGPMFLDLTGTDLPDTGVVKVKAGDEMGTVSQPTSNLLMAAYFNPITPGFHTVGVFQDDELVAYLEDALEVLPTLTHEIRTLPWELQFDARTVAPNADLRLLVGLPQPGAPLSGVQYLQFVNNTRPPIPAQANASNQFSLTLDINNLPPNILIAYQAVEIGAATNWFTNPVFLATP